MARSRTTKDIAKRIALDYFIRPHPWRTAMSRVYAASVVVAALLLLLTHRYVGDLIFAPGPVAVRHRMFDAECAQCHDLFGGTPDHLCLRCHEAPRHHANETFLPDCSSCHFEHQNRSHLAAIDDRHCGRCHGDLKTLFAPAGFDSSIRSFEDGHPDFDASVSGDPDKTELALNHELHLKPGLEGPNGKVRLQCESCHRIDASGNYMEPVTFEKHCRECHPLHLGLILPGETVPHEVPAEVDRHVRERIERLALEKPALLEEEEEGGPRRRRGRGRSTPPAPVATSVWVERQVVSVEGQLWDKTCDYCHRLQERPSALPEVVPPNMPSRWFAHSEFSHRSHRALRCHVCHESAPSSRSTSDVLLPGIKTCLNCHSEAGGARASCAECHIYHDKKLETGIEGNLVLNPLRVLPK